MKKHGNDPIQQGYKELKIRDNAGNYSSPRVSSEIMDCSMPMTFDQYNFCHYQCKYCFAFYFKSNNPSINKEDFHLKAVNIPELIKAISGEKKSGRGKIFYDLFYKNKFLFHWGGLGDPMCNFEKVNKVGFPLIQALGEMNYHTLFSFKGNTIFQKDYVKLFEKYSKQRNFAFQISMVTYDDDMAKNVEIGVPLPKERIKAIKMLSDMGYWTILRLRPYIIGITDESIDDLLEAALEAGINGVSMEFFALDTRATTGMKERYEWISKHIGTKDILKYFKALSPSERGGYMRLNRLVKEDHVKRVYQFCAKHNLVFGCSDPDYKELNTSGSCCAMPDNYKPNPLLENWSRNQLTYHLKEARKAYHTNGKISKLHFDTVFPLGISYLENTDIVNDHIKVTQMTNAARYEHTYRTIIQETWNNLNSPANPRNYFHGKLMPDGVDEQDNLIFKYEPKEYENRWVKEGINLSR
jgi:DNA repair photolyase